MSHGGDPNRKKPMLATTSALQHAATLRSAREAISLDPDGLCCTKQTGTSAMDVDFGKADSHT